jgi:hypothetical protein
MGGQGDVVGRARVAKAECVKLGDDLGLDVQKDQIGQGLRSAL